MTTLREQIIADLENTILNTGELAERGSYHYANGGVSEISLLEVGRWSERKERSSGRHLVWTLVILCRNNDSTGVIDPGNGDHLILDSNPLEKWRLQEVNSRDEHAFELQFTRTELIQGAHFKIE